MSAARAPARPAPPGLVTAAGLAAAALCFAGAHALRGPLNRRHDASRRVLDDANIPRPEVARVISLGHTEWLTDVLWINAALYYGESLFSHLPARYVERYAETMIALDPGFRPAYLWGASSLLLRTVASTRDDARKAGELLRRGLERFPTDPELHLQLGFNLAFDQAAYAGEGTPAWRALHAAGGEHLRFAASAGAGPAWLPLTASSLLREAGRDRDAVAVLCDGLVHTDDPQAVAMIEGRLAALVREGGRDQPLLQAILETVRARRRHYPWMPPTLYLFTGEPVVPGPR